MRRSAKREAALFGGSSRAMPPRSTHPGDKAKVCAVAAPGGAVAARPGRVAPIRKRAATECLTATN